MLCREGPSPPRLSWHDFYVFIDLLVRVGCWPVIASVIHPLPQALGEEAPGSLLHTQCGQWVLGKKPQKASGGFSRQPGPTVAWARVLSQGEAAPVPCSLTSRARPGAQVWAGHLAFHMRTLCLSGPLSPFQFVSAVCAHPVLPVLQLLSSTVRGWAGLAVT